jgi:hypothetical protein
MKNNSIIILISIFFAIINVGCLNDCKNYKPENKYNAINQENLKRIPYSGYDTITFIRNNIDTISFLGIGNKKIITLEDGDLGACGPTTLENNDNYQFSFFSNSIQKKVEIEIRYPNYLDFYFLGKRFVSHLGDLRDPYDLKEIVINNSTYLNITRILSQHQDTLYYNNENGIIKFGFQNGEQWSLIKNK